MYADCPSFGHKYGFGAAYAITLVRGDPRDAEGKLGAVGGVSKLDVGIRQIALKKVDLAVLLP